MRVTVISGGTDGIGRGTLEARLRRGDEVVAIGSNPAKGRSVQALSDRAHFLRADLRSVAETRRVVDVIRHRWPTVDALVLCANRQSPRRVVTDEGLEQTFALYYLSRYLLSHGLRDQLDTAERPVVVNVAGVGVTRGAIHWDDLQLADGYGMVDAQLQAGRANDLLGVDFAARSGGRTRYVLYHPGFTRSGDLSTLPAPVRGVIRAASVFARPVGTSIRPIVRWIDDPPSDALTANDRGRPVPPSTRTLDPVAARRLGAVTEELLTRLDAG
ncbi:SDR family NAD(P)-dependent oxidoreductase [Micromonospora rifamycinica]|uniref:Short chain dehydrogenase n=1 Tax=Micromonospora rifamycinica TaxID=291594 RepID=A0A109IFD4_9ACTN|nr:SDR family NAD(P)-dependent oxidoreductase [Micromonospora rifamycinica]KWV29529.1 short-chain dehydrogenase [Micromonospora rifamycinica]SCG43522.1 short chain dehydrogenase [Micromonospora rifamycinica]